MLTTTCLLALCCNRDGYPPSHVSLSKHTAPASTVKYYNIKDSETIHSELTAPETKSA